MAPLKGFIPWNKGRRGDKMSEESKQKISLATKGVKKSLKMREKLRAYHLGKPLSEEHKRKMRETRVNGMEGKKTQRSDTIKNEGNSSS